MATVWAMPAIRNGSAGVSGARWAILLLVAVGLLLTLPRLGTAGLWDPWEPKYAQTAREMVTTGDLVVPHYREDARLVKPPLTYWMIGASQVVLGVNEASARIPSAILAILCPIALALALAARGQLFAGLLAGLALLTSPQWLMLGRFATPDMLLASLLGMLLAVAIAFPAFPDARVRTALGLTAVVLLAGAVLTDGPRGLLLPAWSVAVWAALRAGRYGWAALAIIVATYAIGQQIYSGPLNLLSHGIAIVVAVVALTKIAGLPFRRMAFGCVLAVALIAPWYIAVFILEPAEAMERLLGYKHGLNLGEGLGEHTGSPGFVLWVVAMGGLPWIGGAVVGLLQAIRARRRAGPELTISAAAIGVLLFFMVSEAKMGHFYGVAQPAMAGLAGVGLVALTRKRDWTILPGLLALGVTCGWVAWHPRRLLDTVTVFTDLHGRVDPIPWLVATVAIWLVVTAIAVATRRRSLILVGSLPAAVFAGYLAMHVVPALETQKGFRQIWTRYVDERGEGEPLGAYGWVKDSAFYYSDNTVVRLKKPEALRRFLAGPGRKFVVAPYDAYEDLERALPPGARWHLLLDEHAYHMLVEYTPSVASRGS